MRCLLPCLLAALAAAGGRSYESDDASVRGNPALRASLEADADQIEMPVRITVTAPTRAEADARMRLISAKLSSRFEDQDGLELVRTEQTFARPRSAGSGSFLSKADKEPDSFTAVSTWALRASFEEDATTAIDELRKQTVDLVDSKAVKDDTESIRVGEATFRLSNPEDYRDALLHRIREDAARAARHLPEGENRLELPSLEERVRFAPLTSSHFVLWLPYTLKHKSQVTADDGPCGCEEGEPSEEPDKDDDSK